jgi:1-pyrroline-5-carboxylate dehydrogenase
MAAKTPRKKTTAFRLTYATMFNPPEILHTEYERALAKVKAEMGKDHAMIIDGKEVTVLDKFEHRSPINQDWLLGTFQKGGAEHARQALDAARKASASWSRLSWRERIRYLRRAAGLIEKRIYEFGAVLSLEVGKNRMEALGDITEAADFLRFWSDQVEEHNGYVLPMAKDPLKGFRSKNVSMMRPYGVWVVISPFNFPAALTIGPSAAALATGNTIVIKPATNTPWSVRLFAECLREAGLPDGVFNYVTGPGSTIGQELIENPGVDGITFTGSYDVGMKIYRTFANGPYPRPTVLELGGKNPAIVSRRANLDHAAIGIVRSAFGLQGQKCSATSRVLVEKPVYDKLITRLADLADKVVVGDPTDRKVFMGPVINSSSYKDFQTYCEEMSQSGRFLTGGKIITDGEYGKGFFCQPTFVLDLPIEHRLWKHEMFLPVATIHAVENLDEAMRIANEVNYGLTAGFYGSEKESEWFFDNIQAGVTYANRPQGATTGAWPGFQPFGGWKGSGSTGKNTGGAYYLLSYLREQSRTIVK